MIICTTIKAWLAKLQLCSQNNMIFHALSWGLWLFYDNFIFSILASIRTQTIGTWRQQLCHSPPPPPSQSSSMSISTISGLNWLVAQTSNLLLMMAPTPEGKFQPLLVERNVGGSTLRGSCCCRRRCCCRWCCCRWCCCCPIFVVDVVIIVVVVTVVIIVVLVYFVVFIVAVVAAVFVGQSLLSMLLSSLYVLTSLSSLLR